MELHPRSSLFFLSVHLRQKQALPPCPSRSLWYDDNGTSYPAVPPLAAIAETGGI